MAVTPQSIAVELGRAADSITDLESAQWQSWIDRAYREIRRRADLLGVDYSTLDPAEVDDVVVLVVARMVRNAPPEPGMASRDESLTVDDGSLRRSTQFRPQYGDAWVLDEWWARLGLVPAGGDGWSGSIPYSRGW